MLSMREVEIIGPKTKKDDSSRIKLKPYLEISYHQEKVDKTKSKPSEIYQYQQV